MAKLQLELIRVLPASGRISDEAGVSNFGKFALAGDVGDAQWSRRG